VENQSEIKAMSYLPSLQTLRAFEAAGRLQSYTKAAEELGLTHGAVSHRIRELEERLGKTLFERSGNSMNPTLAGQELLVQVRQGLSLLEQAFHTKRSGKASAKPIVISAVPILAQTWLFARLREFQELHPEIDIALQSSERVVDLNKDGVDLAIRLGAGGWAGLNQGKLFDDELSPVCTPEYREALGLRAPSDLQRARLLRNPWSPWSRWFKAAGLDWPEPSTGSSIDDSLVLLRAVSHGDCVVLARRWLVIDELRAGRLVTPFPISIPDDFSYWVVWPIAKKERAGVALLRDWLLEQAANEHRPEK
jgi:LysR family glycine cleavage system transcriptional activator